MSPWAPAHRSNINISFTAVSIRQWKIPVPDLFILVKSKVAEIRPTKPPCSIQRSTGSILKGRIQAVVQRKLLKVTVEVLGEQLSCTLIILR